MNKKIILFAVFLTVFMLSGCKKDQIEVDMTNIDKAIDDLISTLPEEKVDIEDTEELDNYLITEIENDIINNEIIENNLTIEEKLPKLKGFTFDDVFNSDELPELPETIEYLEHTWMPMYIHSDIMVKSGIASLYIITAYPYDEMKPKISYNEQFRGLLKDTVNLFGEYIFTENEYISNIEQLTEDYRLSYVFDVDSCYLIAFYQDNVEDSRIDITYYFVSKEIPHTDGGPETAVISYILDNVSNPRLDVYYKTNEGNFVIEYGKEKTLSNETSVLDKKLKLR